MSRWAGLDTEIRGVERAKKNLADDPSALAAYVYNRACAYIGPDHEGVTVTLIETALLPTDSDPEAP